jgi:hypothetical protein
MKVNKKAREAVKLVLQALFERAKARLLGRHGNAMYFQVVRDFGIENSLEGVARESVAEAAGVKIEPGAEIIETQVDEAAAFIDALQARTTAAAFDAIKRKDAEEIRRVFAQATDHVEMIVDEETNRAKNLGILDMIDQVSTSQGIADPIIYGIGPLDAKTCPHCLSMYHCKSNPLVPRVYRRSQFSPAYFKKKTWDGATIHSNAHPRCRHSLSFLAPGFGFDAKGHVQYMGKDHDELQVQKARGDAE